MIIFPKFCNATSFPRFCQVVVEIISGWPVLSFCKHLENFVQSYLMFGLNLNRWRYFSHCIDIHIQGSFKVGGWITLHFGSFRESGRSLISPCNTVIYVVCSDARLMSLLPIFTIFQFWFSLFCDDFRARNGLFYRRKTDFRNCVLREKVSIIAPLGPNHSI